MMTDHAEAAGDASRDRKFLEISADDRIFLTVCEHGDDTRFARVFGETWPKIPAPDRAQMVEHCKRHDRVPGVLGLDITMENSSTLRERRQLGVCDGSGTSLNFYAPAIDRLPPKHVAALIAHELAHVWQASQGTLRHTQGRDSLPDAMLQEMAKEMGRDVATLGRSSTATAIPWSRRPIGSRSVGDSTSRR